MITIVLIMKNYVNSVKCFKETVEEAAFRCLWTHV